MKKLVFAITIFTLLLWLPFSAFAETENSADQTSQVADMINGNDTAMSPVTSNDAISDEGSSTMVIDESDIFNDLKGMSKAQLAKEGYSQQEITTIKNNSYADLVRERAKLPETELSNMGYTAEEIAVLKDPNATDIQLMSANINNFTIYSQIAKFWYASGAKYTYAAVYMSWEWSKVPFCPYKDAIVLMWNHGMTFMPYSENNMCRYTLYRRNTMTGAETMTTTGFTDNNAISPISAVTTSFNLLSAATTPPTANMFCYKGAARSVMKIQDELTDLTTMCTYAHYATLSGISIGIGAGPFSISFSPDTTYKEQVICYTDSYFDWR